jgi:lysophospholipase L1-like esterase
MANINPGPAATSTVNQAAQIVSNPLSGLYTIATLPSLPAGNIGVTAYTSDGGLWVWNGTSWMQVSPIVTGTGISNFNAQNTRKLLAARARVVSNSGLARVAYIGDSNTAGAWSTGNGLASNAISGSPPVRIAKTVTGNDGLTAISDSWFGAAGLVTQANYNAYNSKVVAAGSWNPNNFFTLPGGFAMLANTVSNFAFTPTSAFDTIDIYTMNVAAGGSFTVNVDGGATLATITTVAANVYTKNTVACTLGTHTINCATTSTSSTWLCGMAVHNSTAAALEMYNMGISGITAATYNVAGMAAALATIAPHVTLINITTNDINTTPTSIAAYTANIQALITAALATGDCILMIAIPASGANWNNGVNLTYQAAVYALAASNNIPILDLTQRWVSYAVTNPIMPYGDILHPGPAGYADIAAAMTIFFQ